jgi:hypothetical protein
MSTLFPLKLYCGIKEESLSLTQTDTYIMTWIFKSDCVWMECFTPWFWMFYAISRTIHWVPGTFSLPVKPLYANSLVSSSSYDLTKCYSLTCTHEICNKRLECNSLLEFVQNSSNIKSELNLMEYKFAQVVSEVTVYYPMKKKGP